MAQFQTTWRVVDQLDTNCRPTKKGDPQVAIRTDKGEWIKISGEGVLRVRVGNKIEISEPAQFGKSWYARLCTIDLTPAREPKPEEPKQEPAPAASNGHAPSGNGKIPWLEFQLAFKAAHALALECEPDADTGEWIDRSQARAALVNTFVIAFSNGRIEAPEVPDSDDDDPIPF